MSQFNSTALLELKTSEPRIYNKFLLLFYRYIGRKLPARWFTPPLPDLDPVNFESRKLSIDIVSHCWGYAHLLDYQLSSLVLNPPKTAQITVKVFFSPEDKDTLTVLDFFKAIDVENVRWEWQPVRKSHLFRRAIGRNHAAFTSGADWVWYADCDLIFEGSVIDNVANELKTLNTPLVYPGFEYITSLLPAGDSRLREGKPPEIAGINTKDFERREINRAVGAFQIVRGDLLRKIGYCDSIPLFLTPSSRWLKAYEDTIFRWLVGSEGRKLEAGGTYRIRHEEKGRYKENSPVSIIRKRLRSRQRYGD